MQEPLTIRCKPAGRDDRGQRIKSSPHHGLVDVLITDGPGKGKGVRLNFETAKDFARALRDESYALRARSQSVVRVMHIGNGALVVERSERGGFGTFFSLHPARTVSEQEGRDAVRAATLQVAAAVTNAACQAEQDIPAVSEQVALDHATLARAGFPLGMTRDPVLLERARQLHDTDDELRRYLPKSPLGGMGVARAAMVLPLPIIKMGPAEPGAALRMRAELMTSGQRRELLQQIEQRVRGG